MHPRRVRPQSVTRALQLHVKLARPKLMKGFFFAKEKQRVNSVCDHEYHDGDVGQVWGLQLLKSRSRMRKCGPKRPLKTTSNNQLRAARFSFKYNVTKRPELLYFSHFVAGNVVSFTLICHNHATSAVKLQATKPFVSHHGFQI